MSRSAGSSSGAHPHQQHVAFDFTVPSQEIEFLHMSSDPRGHGHNHEYISPQAGTLRRKRSPSPRDEDENEDEAGEEDEDDEYIPHAGGGNGNGGRNPYYPNGNGNPRGSYGRESTSGGDHGTFGIPLAPLDVEMHAGNASHNTTFRVGGQRKAAQTVGPDGQPPPKKKRRRQALSCTECKRRKIRCDRSQPCAPCTRRGEGDKCKWNILEPVEKFVTRKEYDEIKDSLSRLETILTTTSPGGQGPSSSANHEVAAAVNMVKRQAGLLSKVISNPSSSAGPPSMLHGRGQSNSYGDATSDSVPTVTSSFPHAASRGQPQHSETVGGGGNASFAYNPFPLNVPSQSVRGNGGPSDVGDEEYYGGGARNTISSHSHSTPTEFSRPTSSTYHHTGHIPSMSGHFQSNLPESPFHGPAYPNQLQRMPEINLGGLVVEDQSQSASAMLRGNVDSSGPLSTLANLANATSLASSANRPSNSHLQPIHHQHHNQGTAVNVGQTSPSLTLAPIGAQPIPRTARTGLSISTGGGLAMLPPPAIAPPRLPPAGVGEHREAQLRRVLRTCLPRREICDRLVEYYFEKVEWSLTLLHRSSFMRACETFWFLSEDERVKIVSPTTPSSATSWGGGFRASFLPPASEYSMGYAKLPTNASSSKKRQVPSAEGDSVTPSWISLFLALLCVSLERLGYWDAKSIGIVENVEQYQLHCRNLYDGSQTAMILGDFLKSRALETVQAMVLHIHCQQTLTTTQWEAQIGVTLSIAARLGTIMGLNKLTPEKVGSDQQPGLLKRELGRRAWWNLIERDWTLSPRVGHTYAINPAQNFSDLPANVEWEELVYSRSTFKQQRREIWTGASSFLARIDIARANRELTDQYNSTDGVSYNLLLKHEVMLGEVMSRTPPQLLTLDGEFELSTPQGQWDRIQFTFQKHYSIITLHRPYLIAALLDLKAQEMRLVNSQDASSSHHRNKPAYLKSLDSSVRSAETILDTMEEAISSQYPGVHWWQTIISCYTAAVVLLVERWYKSEAKAGSLESEDADERQRKIRAASALLREQCDAINLFAQAANALDALLDATTSARRKARKSGRRGMDINDVVNPVNVSSRASVTTGNTPPFIKEWIDRPSTPMPSPEPVIRQAPSLSTMALLPGVPLVADTSYDSQFWARIFDLEFVAPPDMTEFFFPAEEPEEVAGDSRGAILFSGIDDSSRWSSAAMEEKGPSETTGGSVIWSAMSGPIGSSGSGEGWQRVSPY